MKKIGFIGLGNMGKGMVENLLQNNLIVTGFDIKNEVFKNFSKYCKKCMV